MPTDVPLHYKSSSSYERSMVPKRRFVKFVDEC
jgi:hypothetical protein